MSEHFPLVPRYRLDDEQEWLVGIDPLRRYWISVNSSELITVVVPGLNAAQFEAFRKSILNFRAMSAGQSIELPTITESPLVITCISKNCYALKGEINGAGVSHLFDHESLEALLMTAHPDWQCAPHHEELGRQMLSLCWQQPAANKVA